MERETGIEPATNSLEGCDSTIELLPRLTFNSTSFCYTKNRRAVSSVGQSVWFTPRRSGVRGSHRPPRNSLIFQAVFGNLPLSAEAEFSDYARTMAILGRAKFFNRVLERARLSVDVPLRSVHVAVPGEVGERHGSCGVPSASGRCGAL